MRPHFDVTVSVWNDFWAPELAAGLAKGGFRILILRSERSSIIDINMRHSELSRILTRLFQRTQQHWLLEAAQDVFESFSRRHTRQSTFFWAWNGHHLAALRSAHDGGQRIIVERGSTHSVWAARRLAEVHGQLGWGRGPSLANRRERRALAEYSLAEKICVPSQFVFKTFLEEGVPVEKLHVNPYGVDIPHWDRVQGKGRGDGPLVFVFTASITPRKGAHILLRAWEKAGLKDAELWLCGGVHFPIQKLGLPIGGNVKFLGFTSHSALLEIYDRASVYVLPSFEEGMARSGLEAMAAGLPVIVTEETGLTDVMPDGQVGWVVPSGDVEALAEALRAAAARRDSLAGFGAIARERMRLDHSKEAYGKRASDFLHSLVAGR